MISEDIKISRLLAAYPSTQKVLNRFSPLFNNQANNEINNAITKRINVKQAAEIAGVRLVLLLNELNSAVNEELIPPKVDANRESKNMINQKPEKLNKINPDKFLQLDVRSIIDSWKDPFPEIMSVVKSLKSDEVFQLINSFEPFPLYTVLEKKGYDHWTEKVNNVFNVFFFRNDQGSLKMDKSVNKNENDNEDCENVIELDVRELVPPEPMMRILENISRVSEKTVMVVHHHREPMLLYPKLDERGYSAITNKINNNYYKVVITKKRKE